MESGKDNKRSIYVSVYDGWRDEEFDVIHIHIQLPTWYRQGFFFFSLFSFALCTHARNTLCHSRVRRKTTDTRDHVEYDIKNVSISNSMIIKNG